MIITTNIIEPPPPPVYHEPRVGVAMYLTGVDGSVWDLMNGPMSLQRGVTGLVPPDFEHRWSISPLLPGAFHQGYRIPEQPVSIPISITAESALALRDLDAALWRALSPDNLCLLTLASPDAEIRTLLIRFVGAGGASFEDDPLMMRNVKYTLSFIAEDPFWQGPTIQRSFAPMTAPAQFFAPSGSAGVLNLLPGNSTANSTVRNEGDVRVFPIYAISGSVASFSVGVGASTINYGAVANGTTVWIDTHPSRQTVGFARGDNSETAWLGVTARKFEPIPPGAEVPITVSLTTPGANALLTVELTPRFRRPW